jgi:hypothetical protein
VWAEVIYDKFLPAKAPKKEPAEATSIAGFFAQRMAEMELIKEKLANVDIPNEFNKDMNVGSFLSMFNQLAPSNDSTSAPVPAKVVEEKPPEKEEYTVKITKPFCQIYHYDPELNICDLWDVDINAHIKAKIRNTETYFIPKQTYLKYMKLVRKARFDVKQLRKNELWVMPDSRARTHSSVKDGNYMDLIITTTLHMHGGCVSDVAWNLLLTHKQKTFPLLKDEETGNYVISREPGPKLILIPKEVEPPKVEKVVDPDEDLWASDGDDDDFEWGEEKDAHEPPE